MEEPLEHRERRLNQLGEAIEKHLDEGWLYFLVIGLPGDPDSANMICKASFKTNKEILDMLQVIVERYSKGVEPQELE